MREEIELLLDPRFWAILMLALLPLIVSCGIILVEA
jgi:hypothetical protein